MKNKELDPPVTRSEFLKAIGKLATKDDLKNFPTKEDAKSFATKDDLKNFATKDDIKNFATKDDIKNFATKDDLKKLDDKLDKAVIRLSGEIIKTQDDLKEVKENMATKEDISKILDAIDAFAQKSENYDNKALFHSNRIENHEERITKLEKVA